MSQPTLASCPWFLILRFCVPLRSIGTKISIRLPARGVSILGNCTLFERTFQWELVIATFLSVLSLVPRHCACLADFFHPKLREIDVVLISLKLITLTLRRAVSAPIQPPPSPIQSPTQQQHHWCVCGEGQGYA